MKQPKDFFSKFVNWLNALGKDIPSTNREGGSQDFFSKLMNRIIKYSLQSIQQILAISNGHHSFTNGLCPS